MGRAPSRAVLRQLERGKTSRAPESATGAVIRETLERLQRGVEHELRLDEVVEAFLPGVCQFLDEGYMVSLTRTRDGRSVRLAVYIDAKWYEFYAGDPGHAEALCDALRGAAEPSEPPAG